MNKKYTTYISIISLSVLLLFLGCSKSSDYDRNRDYLQHITVEDGMDFYFYCSANISSHERNNQYTKLLLYMHGANFNATDHYTFARNAAYSATDRSNVIVLAPQYEMHNYRNNYYWTKYSWKDGKKSINAVPKISSFALLDTLLINHVLKTYPNLETIVLSGHSAGAQYIYRYAVLSQLPDIVEQEVIYLPLNPSSVAYLGPERWNEKKDRFEVPLNAPSCPGYDAWIFGLTDVSANEYLRGIEASEIINYFPLRQVTIGSGTEDLNEDNENFDCEELYQGKHRHERAINIQNYMDLYFPANTHQLIKVEGVSHKTNDMINSPEILDYLSKVFN
ncbi:hypothetical protein [Saccharicrinis aurantiacus]|uniref:hypothetical protein n=1 Tax=Saccharicrinis aurantiacus TaxID=1849719 RepID=UPI00094FB792|nr:hypothetical protein [Saccharicrinis aurantiacus]